VWLLACLTLSLALCYDYSQAHTPLAQEIVAVMSSSSELHVIRVTKAFRTSRRQRLTALDNVSLWLRRGETVSVVGPTGCGKSTLLRVVAGLDLPDSGTVTFDNEDVAHLSPGKRGIGLVFQNYALYPHFKVHGNIAFYFRLRRWSPEEIDAKVHETANVMGLGFEKLLGRMPRNLSGGEKQRVALARCLSHNPRVLLLDEPFSNLDASLRLQTRGEVKQLIERFGLTTLFVTHDQTEAVAMGHRLAVMYAGTIAQIGTYHELYYQPANTFVAGFVGSPPMHLFPAQRRAQQITLLLEKAHIQVGLPEHLQQRLAPDAMLTVGIRPEHMRLVSPDSAAALPVTVDMVETSLSDNTQTIYARHGQVHLCAKVGLQQPVRSRETVWLALPSEHLYFFDQHGLRL
jgi:ABC-type sugar transport system ATPase subunit